MSEFDDALGELDRAITAARKAADAMRDAQAALAAEEEA
jgi:hypothetical protein